METSIRVKKATRDHLARVARERMHGKSLDEALEALLIEHERMVDKRTAALLADETLMEQLRRARRRPLSEAIPHSNVVRMMKERMEAEGSTPNDG